MVLWCVGTHGVVSHPGRIMIHVRSTRDTVEWICPECGRKLTVEKRRGTVAASQPSPREGS